MSDPLLSVLMLAYNQERFVRSAVQSLLWQTYSPLEIILSDDASTDRTFEIIEEEAGAYRGPHTIRLNRNKVNLGIGGHVNRLMEVARGELIVAAAGDDISRPNRVDRLYQTYLESERRAMSLHSSHILIDQAGKEIGTGQDFQTFAIDLSEIVRSGTRIFGCTHAWHRSVFDKFGPLPVGIQQEDEVIPFRSLLVGDIAYVREPLVLYRLHEGNFSRLQKQRETLTATLLDIREVEMWTKTEEIARSYLQDLRKGMDTLDSEARKALEEEILRRITSCEVEIYARNGSKESGLAVLHRAVKFRVAPRKIAKLLVSIIAQRLYSSIKYHRYLRGVRRGTTL